MSNHNIIVLLVTIGEGKEKNNWPQILTNGVLVLVCVNACIHNSSEQIIHDACQGLSIEHAMQSSYKHSVPRVQPLRGATHIVTV